MKRSNFQFTNPRVVDLNFNLNRGFRNDPNTKVTFKLDFKVNVHRLEGNEAIVELTVKSENNDITPFSFSATEGAKFNWSDTFNEEETDALLNVNAPALLLGYVRPLIASISSASGFGGYNIPFMDFTQNREQQHEDTSVQH